MGKMRTCDKTPDAKHYYSYTEEIVTKVLAAMNIGMSIKLFAAKVQISRNTLDNALHWYFVL